MPPSCCQGPKNGSAGASPLVAVRTFGCGALTTNAAKVVVGLHASVELLIGYWPFERCPLGEIAPAAAVEIPRAVRQISGLESLLPLERLEQISALRLLEVL